MPGLRGILSRQPSLRLWPRFGQLPGAYAQTGSFPFPRGLWPAAPSPMASMGSSSPMIPYAGSFGGFMPYRMAAGSSGPVSFSAPGSSVLESTRTSFRLSPMSSGMGVGLGPKSGLFALWAHRARCGLAVE